MGKLQMWRGNWDEAEKEWDRGAAEMAAKHPIKGLKKLPNMPGITEETAKHLKWKSLKWMITKDHKREILRGFLKHPFKYGKAFFQSVVKKKSFKRDGDFFLYGLQSLSQFKLLLANPEAVVVLGFSYCHKPHECPSGRFNSDCIADPDHPVCRQCFIGKALNAANRTVIPVIIPTIHYIGGKIFEVVHAYPKRPILFIITACELTLEMFGDWGNMVNLKGLGVRLDGRICNTMKAFELSEQGIKPGLTVVLDETQKIILDMLRFHQSSLK